MTVTLPPELLEWLDVQCESGGRFKDRSHAVEYALVRIRSEPA